jgi:hypothetical protein
MKVTNTSGVIMHVRGVEGVVPIAAGKTANIEFTDEQLERARGRTFLTIEGEHKAESNARPAGKKRADSDKAVPAADAGA